MFGEDGIWNLLLMYTNVCRVVLVDRLCFYLAGPCVSGLLLFVLVEVDYIMCVWVSSDLAGRPCSLELIQTPHYLKSLHKSLRVRSMCTHTS